MANKRSNRGRIPAAVSAAAWAGLIACGSLRPIRPGAVPFLLPGADKIAHVIAYGVLCLLIVRAARGRLRTRLLPAAGLAVLYGTVIECLQPLAGRAFDVLDLLANAAGVAGALLLARLLVRRSGERTPQSES